MPRKKISIKANLDTSRAVAESAAAARRYVVYEKSDRRIQVALTQAQYDAAAEVAQAWRVSLSALVKAALQAAVDEYQRDGNGAESEEVKK